MDEFGGHSAQALEWLRQYKKLIAKMPNLSEEESKELKEIESKLAHTLQPSQVPAHPQRKSLRVSTNLSLVLQNQAELKKYYIKNISGGGLFIATNESFNIGKQLKVELTLPGEIQSEVIDVEVAWVNPRPIETLPKGVGVKFLQLSDAQRKKINKLLESSIEKQILNQKESEKK